MKFRGMWLPLLAALALPGAARAQEDPRPGMIGVMFDVERTRTGDDAGERERQEVRVMEVRPGSPAERAGVRAGDVVVRLNGRAAGDAFARLPHDLQAGDTVRLRIRRGGDERDLVVVAEPRPDALRFGITRRGPGEERVVFVGPDSLPLEALTLRLDSLHTRLLRLDTGQVRIHVDSMVNLLSDSAHVFIRRMPNVEFRVGRPGVEEEIIVRGPGMHDGPPLVLEGGAMMEGRPFFMELGRRAAAGAELAEMNEGLSRYFGNVRSGALVIDVSPGTPAARAGLEPGDVIVQAGGRDVNDPEDVRRALTRAQDGRVALEVIRQGRRREISLQWEGDHLIRREIHRERAPTRAPAPRREGEVAPAPRPRN